MNEEPGVPELFEEDHVCTSCGLAYQDLTVEEAVDELTRLPLAIGAAVSGVPLAERRLRPGDGAWSVTEYLCHLRDVYVAFTIRLHRARTVDTPVFEPMLNDLRARRFRYNERDAEPVLVELAAAVSGFVDEIAHVRADGWERGVRRLPGEHRTARWLVRQALHEGRHHLDDIRRTHAEVTRPA